MNESVSILRRRRQVSAIARENAAGIRSIVVLGGHDADTPAFVARSPRRLVVGEATLNRWLNPPGRIGDPPAFFGAQECAVTVSHTPHVVQRYVWDGQRWCEHGYAVFIDHGWLFTGSVEEAMAAVERERERAARRLRARASDAYGRASRGARLLARISPIAQEEAYRLLLRRYGKEQA